MKKNKKIRNAIIFIAALAYVAFSIFIAATHTKNSLYNDRLPNLPTKSVVNTAWNSGVIIDYCNNVWLANESTALYNVLGSGADDYIITGWAVDMDNQTVLGDLYVVVENTVIKCDYGYKRTEVAEALANPKMANCGFSVTIPANLVKNNMYEITNQIEFYMISYDNKYLYWPIVYRKPL